MEAGVLPEAPIGGRPMAAAETLDRVIYAGSATFGVRLELASPIYAVLAGLNCRVRFPIEAADPARGGP